MPRRLARALAVVLLLVAVFVVLALAELLVPIASSGASSMAPTIPACTGRVLAEGLTYKFRDPRRGEIVAIHAVGTLDGDIAPDPDSRDVTLTKRVVGVPGDQVLARGGRVYVNGVKIDDIRTRDFKRVDLGGEQFFVLGDNRSASQDSRDFGPVPGDAIFGRVFLVFWPLGDFGSPESRHAGAPPGPTICD